MSSGRLPVWQMIKEAIDAGVRTNAQAKDWILARYPGTNPSTVYAQINFCTVNSPSRIHGPENQQERRERSRLDILYKTDRGRFEAYDPAKHGVWLIRRTDSGKFEIYQAGDSPVAGTFLSPVERSSTLIVAQASRLYGDIEHAEEALVERSSTPPATSTFAAEAHLRDYLASNLHVIEEGLQPYGDEFGSSHVEYRTDVGPIDLLCIDKDGGLLVVELKVDRSSDAVAGQILRYVNWVRRHLANGRPVRGVIIAKAVPSTLLYSIDSDDTITAREYELQVSLKPPQRTLPSCQ